ncbi:MAG: hypothetical protein KBG35_00960, partial [Thauera sp.]|nr:hypothetical protein [Thauera sp.]
PRQEQDKRQLPLRVRLMLWMLAIFLIVQLSIAFVFRLYLARSIEEFFVERAVERVDVVAEALQPALPAITDAQLEDLVTTRFRLGHKEVIRIDVLDANGKPIASNRPPAVPLDAALFHRASDSEFPFSVRSRVRTVESAAIRVEARRDDAEGLALILPDADAPVAPTHWSFGQLASLVGAPASYLRQLPAALAGINLQYGLSSHRALS